MTKHAERVRLWPLPNEVLRPGALCPKSGAAFLANHVDSTEHEDWGVCRDCGEVLSLRGEWLPVHRIPAELIDVAES